MPLEQMSFEQKSAGQRWFMFSFQQINISQYFFFELCFRISKEVQRAFTLAKFNAVLSGCLPRLLGSSAAQYHVGLLL
jgi:hypothetical protein